MLKGMDLTVKKGWKFVILEGDCLNVIKALNGDLEAISWEAESYVRAARQLISKCDSVVFYWIPRGINEMAHYVCRFGLLNSFCNYESTDTSPSSVVSTSSIEWRRVFLYP
ncbi:Ribonuclease H-like domain containing protein [Trema orientale]|uniref:Ribonuclease H-like domain containing protein n=1 Tax=Trema orientale TaxID=63057 RepID=A0A2P5CWB2_TREOI|nr:Ribonuclease H-like domain containing protein [Trema orientale]